MGIDDLRERMERLLGDRPTRDAIRQQSGAFHDALVELKVAIQQLNIAIATTDKELQAERDQRDTSLRRGKLAADIGDRETVEIAQQFAARHDERISLLERKIQVQRDELAAAEREYAELSDKYRAAKQGVPLGTSAPDPADPLADGDPAPPRFDRKAAEAAVEEQLAMLKKKLGKQ